MNVALILIMCVIGSDRCLEARPYAPDLTLIGCAVAAQQIAASWLREHPGYEVKRWRCEMGVRRSRDA